MPLATTELIPKLIPKKERRKQAHLTLKLTTLRPPALASAQQRSPLTFSILPFQIKGQISDLNLSLTEEGGAITLATCQRQLAPKTLRIKDRPINERSLCFQRPRVELNLFNLAFKLSSSTETRPLKKRLGEYGF